MARTLFTSESVTEGHPDKICDQISDAVLDAILEQDSKARVACETTVATGMVLCMGEISTTARVDIQQIARDVIVDIRAGSPTRFRWLAVELSAHDHTMLFIPKGFAHGFLTLTDDVLFQYKTDAYYDPASEGAVRWNDPMLAVDWGVETPILSPKDAAAPFLEAANLD